MPQPHEKQDIELPKKVDPSLEKFRPNPEARAEEERLHSQLDLLKKLADKNEEKRLNTINNIAKLGEPPTIIDSKLVKIAHLIDRDCQDAKQAFVSNYGSKSVLYRGIKDTEQEFLQGESHTQRQPKSVVPEVQAFIDKILEIAGFTALRRNSISCNYSANLAKSYGTPYLIFPFDSCTYTFSEKYRFLTERLASVSSVENLLNDVLDMGYDRTNAIYEIRYVINDLKNPDSMMHNLKLGVTQFPKAKEELILVLERTRKLLVNNKPVPAKVVSFIRKRLSKIMTSEKDFNIIMSVVQSPPLSKLALTSEGAKDAVKQLGLKSEKDYSYSEMLENLNGEVMISGKYYAVKATHVFALKQLFINVKRQQNA